MRNGQNGDRTRKLEKTGSHYIKLSRTRLINFDINTLDVRSENRRSRHASEPSEGILCIELSKFDIKLY